MRVAVFSDVHGNLVALAAVLAHLRPSGADRIVLAGDLCLDGPQPAAVVDLARASGWTVLEGNTDHYLHSIGSEEEARAAGKDWPMLAWTQAQLGAERLAYLRRLPFSVTLAPPEPADPRAALLIVHANPRDLETKLWPGTPPEEVKALVAGVVARTVVHGHIHIQSVRHVGRRRLVNVASAGQPKNGDWRAAYSLFTWRAGRWGVEQRRVDYDYAAAEADIRASGMPEPEQQIETLRRARYG